MPTTSAVAGRRPSPSTRRRSASRQRRDRQHLARGDPAARDLGARPGRGRRPTRGPSRARRRLASTATPLSSTARRRVSTATGTAPACSGRPEDEHVGVGGVAEQHPRHPAGVAGEQVAADRARAGRPPRRRPGRRWSARTPCARWACGWSTARPGSWPASQAASTGSLAPTRPSRASSVVVWPVADEVGRRRAAAGEDDVADDRAGLLRQARLVEALHLPAVEHGRGAEHLGRGDHARCRRCRRGGPGRRRRVPAPRRASGRSHGRAARPSSRASEPSVDGSSSTSMNDGQSPLTHEKSRLHESWSIRVRRPSGVSSRLDRQAVGHRAAVAAALADARVDGDPLRGGRDLAALAAAAELGGARLVVDEDRDPVDGGELGLHVDDVVAVADVDLARQAGPVVVARRRAR